MNSSTSPSSATLPWLTVRLLVAASATFALGALYTVRLHPEIVFFQHDHQLKMEWARKLEQGGRPKFVFAGGSACGTTVDGGRMLEQHGLPALNLGLAAAMGARILTAYGLHALRPGDTLVVCLEPNLLLGHVKLEATGVQFCFATGQLGLLRHGKTKTIPWAQALVQLRPGAYHAFARLGKILLGQPSYRYPYSGIRPGGWVAVELLRDFPDPTPAPLLLSPEGRALLSFLGETCAARGVRTVYAVPQMYAPPARADEFRQERLRFLHQISEFMPVLPDPEMGIHSVRADYADTEYHFTAAAATRRTDMLAERLAAGKTWTRAMLEQRLKENRWADE